MFVSKVAINFHRKGASVFVAEPSGNCRNVYARFDAGITGVGLWASAQTVSVRTAGVVPTRLSRTMEFKDGSSTRSIEIHMKGPGN